MLNYYRNRVEMDIEMLDAAEIVDQSWCVCRILRVVAVFHPRLTTRVGDSESARVFGVDFHSVRTRGSQFKVESVMFKISKPESFMLLSPNRVQVCRSSSRPNGDFTS